MLVVVVSFARAHPVPDHLLDGPVDPVQPRDLAHVLIVVHAGEGCLEPHCPVLFPMTDDHSLVWLLLLLLLMLVPASRCPLEEQLPPTARLRARFPLVPTETLSTATNAQTDRQTAS